MRVIHRLRDLVLLLIFVAFTAFGLFLLIAGEGVDRMLGLMGLLMFGFGGAAYFASTRRREATALRVTTVTFDGRTERAVVVPVRKSKWLATLVGTLGMGAGALVMGIFAPAFTDPGESPLFTQVVGYGTGAMFLLLGLRNLVGIRRGPPRLALLQDGIDMSGMAACFVPWDAVTAVGVYEMNVRGGRQDFTGLQVSDPARIVRSRGSRLLMAGSRGLSGWDVTYPASLFDVTADELATLVAAFHQHPGLRAVAASLPDGHLSFEEFAAAHPELDEQPAGSLLVAPGS